MVEKQLFQIIRHFLNNEPVTTELDWPNVWSLARKHSLGQFVSLYMKQLPGEQEIEKQLEHSITNSHAAMVVRKVNQDIAIKDIHAILELKGCYHLFMKGSVTRDRYASAFWRPMGDIDFLYQEAQHEIVKTSLLENGFYGFKAGRKNDTYYRKKNICVEAHRQLVPSDSSFFKYCSKVWERAHVANGCNYLFEMDIEDELIFNIVHLAIHFLEGGAGIRFILDVYVYNHLEMDFKYVEHELSELDLLDFYHNISELAENWFGYGKKTSLTEKLASFIIKNGTFGTVDNSSSLAVREGRWKYLRKMCFPSYKEMISAYPWLKGKYMLLPLAWILRGFRVWKHNKRSLSAQIRKAKRGDRRYGKNLHKFYQECGLRSTL